MKVAVTGATGFVGRHVVAELVQRGADVVLALRPGSSPLATQASIPVVRIAIADPSADAFEHMGRPDVLVHLAWGGLPNYRSLHHFEVELPAHYRFLKGLVRSGLGALLVTGTCFEYGMTCGALHEQMPPAPDNPYALAKDTLRRQLEFLRAETALRFTWARLFYLYGEGQAANSLYPQLRRAVAAKETTFAMSGGEQLRDYLPIETAARHLASLALSERGAGIVNVCSGQPVSVRSLVEQWIAKNEWSIEPAFGRYPYPDHEAMAFWGSARKLHEHLDLTT